MVLCVLDGPRPVSVILVKHSLPLLDVRPQGVKLVQVDGAAEITVKHPCNIESVYDECERKFVIIRITRGRKVYLVIV